MTDQTPDRPDGDGLQSRAVNFAISWGASGTHGNMLAEFAIREIVLAARPTRDGAEGAGEGELIQFFLRQLDGPMPSSTEQLAKELAKAFKTKFPFVAPPKPAPDAMRKGDRDDV